MGHILLGNVGNLNYDTENVGCINSHLPWALRMLYDSDDDNNIAV